MAALSGVLFSKMHLMYPTEPLNALPQVSRVDQLLSGIALVILGILTLGIVPIYYYRKAKQKIQKFNDSLKDQQTPSFPNQVSLQDLKTFQHQEKKCFSIPAILDFVQSKAEFLADQAPQKPIYTINLDPAKLPANASDTKYQNKTRDLTNIIFSLGFDKNSLPAKLLQKLNPINCISYLSHTIKSAHSKAAALFVPGSQSYSSIKKRIVQGRCQIYQRLQENAGQWIGKRVSILCNGSKIDAYILGKKNTLSNGRWTVFSNGHGSLAEENALSEWEHAQKIQSNMIIYNYPGVGCSEGAGTRNCIVASYEAVMRFLEDSEKGIGAKEIIGWGTSMGGGVQGHARKRHEFKKYIHYAFVDNQTYRTLEDAVGSLKTGSLRKLVKPIGWQLSSKSSERLRHPQIVVQRASKLHPERKEDILHDGLFTPEGSLAGHLLAKKTQWPRKKFVGIRASHCSGFSGDELTVIYQSVTKALEPGFTAF